MSVNKTDIQQRLARGRGDINYFAEEVLGIKLNRSQRRMFRLFSLVDNWDWAYRFIAHVAANQVGKTVGLAIVILWACIYKIGTPYGSDERSLQNWLDAPYLWFHLAPSQNQAYHTLNDIRLIIRGAHPAQEIGQTQYGLKYNLPANLVREDKVATYYDGLYFASGAVCQFRTTEEKAHAILGYRANGISVDEAAFEKHLRQINNETLLMRLISTNGPLIEVSTPDGINDFFEVVEAIRGASEQVDGDTLWMDPAGAQGLVLSTIEDNVGFGYTPDAVERMEANLDETTKEQQLRGVFLEPSEAFFVPSARVLQVFTARLPERMSPRPGHNYVIFWDPSASSDPTACIILDITQQPFIGVEMIHTKRPTGIDRLLTDIWNTHLLWNSAIDRTGRKSTAVTGYDATSMGGTIIRQSLRGLSPQRPINFGGTAKTKRDALVNLRAMMLKGGILIPDSWSAVKREILNYRTEDESIQQDLVIALAGAAAIASGRNMVQSADFNPHSRIARTPWR